MGRLAEESQETTLEATPDLLQVVQGVLAAVDPVTRLKLWSHTIKDTVTVEDESEEPEAKLGDNFPQLTH